MLTVYFITAGPEYYLKQSSGEYYLRGGGPPGQWYGRGKAKLGLPWAVGADAFRSLFEGQLEGRSLVQIQEGKKHQPAWDLTFSAPKPFSVLFATANRRLRRALQRIHMRAVKKALRYLEKVAAYTRRGKGGAQLEAAQLVFALFTHFASRDLDPQLHTHAVLMNVCVREDGTTGTIVSKTIYDHKMAAGAVYQAALAEGVRRLGFKTKTADVGFHIEGVPEASCREQSKRRKAIEKLLGDRDQHSQRAANVACLDTRKAKEEPPLSELFEKWRQSSARFGLTERAIDRLRQPAPRLTAHRNPQVLAEKQSLDDEARIQAAVKKITETQNHFSARELYRQALQDSLAAGVETDRLYSAVERELADNLITVGRSNGYLSYTTPEILALEQDLLATVDRLAANNRHCIDPTLVAQVLDRRLPLDDTLPPLKLARNREQRPAVVHVTTKPGAIQVIMGGAGTGKTFTVGVAAEAMTAAGLTVQGITIAGAAARRLEEGTGIKSDTLALFLEKIKHATLVDDLLTGTKYYISKPTKNCPSGEVLLSSKHVLFLDEAALCATKQMAEFLKPIEAVSAKLVLVGDRRQLQPVEAGCPMRAIEERVGRAELNVTTRQELHPLDPQPDWQSQAVEHFSKGESVDALLLLAERGRVSVLEDHDATKIALVRDWTVQSVERPQAHLILAATNADVDDLNDLCQLARRQRELIEEKHIRVNDEKIHLHDRVVFTERSRVLGLENGDFGSVIDINRQKKTLTIELDRGSTVTVPIADYSHVKRGYAITVFKSQGASVERTSILCGSKAEDLHHGYVMASRHEEECKLYVSRFEAGNLLQDLAIRMGTPREKGLASELLRETERLGQPLSRIYYERPINDGEREKLDLAKLERLEGLLAQPQQEIKPPTKSKEEIQSLIAELRQRAKAGATEGGIRNTGVATPLETRDASKLPADIRPGHVIEQPSKVEPMVSNSTEQIRATAKRPDSERISIDREVPQVPKHEPDDGMRLRLRK